MGSSFPETKTGDLERLDILKLYEMGMKKYIVQYALSETNSLLSEACGRENDRVSILHSAAWHVLCYFQGVYLSQWGHGDSQVCLESLHNEQLRNNM